MASYHDLLDAIARVRSVTGDSESWKTGLTGDDVATACNPASSSAALGAVLAKLAAAHPEVFLAGSPAGAGVPPPQIGEGATAEAIRDAQAALAHQNTAAAQVDLQVVTAVLSARSAHDDGAAELAVLQRDIEVAVAARADLGTPAGAREFQRFLIGKLRDIREVVENSSLDATSKAALASALATLYASATPEQPGPGAGPSGDRCTPSPDTASEATLPEPEAPHDFLPDDSAALDGIDPLPPDPFWAEGPLDPYWTEVPEPGLSESATIAAAPPPPAPTPIAPAPAPATPWGGAPAGGVPFGGGAPPGGGLLAPTSPLPGPLPEWWTTDLLGAGRGEEAPVEPTFDPGPGPLDDPIVDRLDTTDPASDEQPGEAPPADTSVELPDGDTVTAPSPQLAAVITSAIAGTPIPEAFRLQGITVPEPGSAVSAPLEPARVGPADIGVFTDRHALALGNGKILLDGQIRPIADASGPGFLGWQHPPAPEPTNATPDIPAPNSAATTAPS